MKTHLLNSIFIKKVLKKDSLFIKNGVISSLKDSWLKPIDVLSTGCYYKYPTCSCALLEIISK